MRTLFFYIADNEKKGVSGVVNVRLDEICVALLKLKGLI